VELPDRYLELKEVGIDRRNLRPTYHFMMKCLLYSRMETGLVSNKDYYDEDVNVYIAHLLNGFVNPSYIESARKYVSRYDTEVFRRLACSKDARLKYTLYKTNADFLLVSLGIFDNPTAVDSASDSPNPATAGSGAKLYRPSEEAYIGRGRTYYRFAYTFSQQIHSRNAAITEVLEKLSIGFEKYTRILAHMRGEYLDLLKRLSKGEIYHLERSINEERRREKLRCKQDEFLDLYLAWKKTRSPDVKAKIEELLDEIRSLDPSFRFEMSD
jgi:hypothetical protein